MGSFLCRPSGPIGALALTAAILTAAPLTGCGGPFPADTEGTLQRATGGTLYVGVTEHEPWTMLEDDGDVTGIEPELLEDYAATIDAEIDWTTGSESVLADELDNGELDIVIGGLTSSAPWTGKMAFTRPYATVRDESGQQQNMVMGVRAGENALLVSLETFLSEEVSP